MPVIRLRISVVILINHNSAVQLPVLTCPTCVVDTFVTPIFFGEEDLPSDQVTLYARELMLMGLLWYSFKDAISEGDGPAVMSYWKVMTIMFKLTNHSK